MTTSRCNRHFDAVAGQMILLNVFLISLRIPSREMKTISFQAPVMSETLENHMSFCETETFHATCAVDEVIVITHARYGRMRISRCVKLDYGHLGCVADVIELADSRCSGRRRCDLKIPDSDFAKYKPCPDDLKPYLEIGFKCIKVQKSTDFCIFPRSTTVTSSQHGYLASLVTEMTACGGVNTPWTIEVSAGQVIRLILYDFGVARSKMGSISSAQCHTYAMLREPIDDDQRQQQHPGRGGVIRATRNVTVCGGVSRQSVVYVTSGHRLEIGLVRNDNVIYGSHFMFEYQAVGCPNLATLQNAWYIRSGDSLTVKCNFSKDVHQMKCKDNTWIGDKWNCTGIYSAANEERLSKNGLTIPYGLSLLIILAIAIGTFVLLVGLVFLRRRSGGSCVDVEQLSPVVQDKQQQYVISSLVRTLTGSIALQPDKLPWQNPLHYGTSSPHLTIGSETSYAQQSVLATAADGRTRCSPSHRSLYPPPPPPLPLYPSLRRRLPCGCDAILEDTADHCDVTSRSLVHDEINDYRKYSDENRKFPEYFVLDRRRPERRLSSTIFSSVISKKLNRWSKEPETEEEEREKEEFKILFRSRPTSFRDTDDSKMPQSRTNADVLPEVALSRVAVPEIVSDCRHHHQSFEDDVMILSPQSNTSCGDSL